MCAEQSPKIMLSDLLTALYFLQFKVHRKVVLWLTGGLFFTQLLAEAFWMSVLSLRHVAAIDYYHYKRAKKYQGKGFNTSLFFDWEEVMVNNWFLKCKSIMVLASGGGRELYALARMGCHVEGYECNRGMVKSSAALLRSEGFNVSVAWVPPDHCPDNGIIYDGIIIGWGSYNHIRGRNKRLQLLREALSHLSKGAPLLVSFWHTSPEIERYCRRLYKVHRFFCMIFHTPPGEKGDRLYPVSGHYFTLEEVRSELTEAGFSVAYEASSPYGHIVALAT